MHRSASSSSNSAASTRPSSSTGTGTTGVRVLHATYAGALSPLVGRQRQLSRSQSSSTTSLSAVNTGDVEKNERAGSVSSAAGTQQLANGVNSRVSASGHASPLSRSVRFDSTASNVATSATGGMLRSLAPSASAPVLLSPARKGAPSQSQQLDSSSPLAASSARPHTLRPLIVSPHHGGSGSDEPSSLFSQSQQQDRSSEWANNGSGSGAGVGVGGLPLAGLADGLTLLRGNLHRLLPNTTLSSARYKSEVERVLGQLDEYARELRESSQAAAHQLALTRDAARSAESKERSMRRAVASLGLDGWGRADELRRDIRALERQLRDRAKFVPDSDDGGMRLDIESEGEGESKQSTAPPNDSTSSSSDPLSSLLPPSGLDQARLVWLKFKRLEQLVWILRRQLAAQSRYPHQERVEKKYGSIEGLLEQVERLEADKARLEAKLAGAAGGVVYREESLLRPRDLSELDPAMLHLLIVGLQQTLASYLRLVDETGAIGSEFASGSGAQHHPLGAAIRAWSASVEREAKRKGLGSANGEKSRSRMSGGANGAPVKPLPVSSDALPPIDIDDVYQRLLDKRAAAAGQRQGGATSGRASARVEAGGKSQRASSRASNITASSGSAAADRELAAQVQEMSLQLRSLRDENARLNAELSNMHWIERVLRAEGLVSDATSEASADGPSATAHDESKTSASDADEPSHSMLSVVVSSEDADESLHHPDAADASFPPTVRASQADTLHHSASASSSALPSSRPSSLSGVSTRALLRHLSSIGSELQRARRGMAQTQQLFLERERRVQEWSVERAQVMRVLAHVLSRYPNALADLDEEGGGQSSQRSSARRATLPPPPAAAANTLAAPTVGKRTSM